MLRPVRWLAAAILIAVLFPSGAHGLLQVPQWQRHRASIPCPSFGACASTVVTSVTTPRGSFYTVTFANPFNLQFIDVEWGVVHPLFDDPFFGNRGWFTRGSVEQVFGFGGPGSFLPDIFSSPPGFFYSPGGASGLFGCAAPSGGPGESGYYRICPQAGFAGSVTFLLETSLPAPLPALSFFYLNRGGQNGAGPLCTATIPCTVDIVPEPSIWLLVGSGLAALGVVGAIRRRRRLSREIASFRWR